MEQLALHAVLSSRCLLELAWSQGWGGVANLRFGIEKKGKYLLSGPGLVGVFISINSLNSHLAQRGRNNHPNFTDGETDLERESN